MTDGLEANIKKYSEQIAQDAKSRAFVPLSDAYRQLGRYDEAILVAQEGVKQHPNYIGGKMALARAYFENGDIDSAQELFDAILLVSPDNLLANRIFAEVCAQKGHADQAIQALKRVISIEPNDLRSKQLLESIQKKSAPQVSNSEPQPSVQESVATPDPISEPEQQSTPPAPSNPASEAAPPISQSAPRSTSLRSATIAELYRSQGHLGEALKVYRALLETEPENAGYAEKINEIEMAMSPKKPNVPQMSSTNVFQKLLERIQGRRRSL